MQVKLFQKLAERRGFPLDAGTRVPFVITLPDGGKRARLKDNEKVTNDAEDVT
jgi:hypothetical protein